jgi:hypothetical protein
MTKTRQDLPAYAPVIFSAVPAVWVAVTWDAEPSLVLPVLICAFPLIARTRPLRIAFRWIAVLLLSVFDFLAMFSVGRLFVPATIAMVLAALWALVAEVIDPSSNGEPPTHNSP